MMLFTALVAVMVAVRYGMPALTRRWRAAARARRQSERYAFNELRATLRQDNPKAIYHALQHWLTRLDVGCDARRFATIFGTDELNAAVNQLSIAAYADSDDTSNLSGLYAELASARSRCKRARSHATRSTLPELNP